MRVAKFNNRHTVRGMVSVPCSDWGHTWGLGTNKLGKLYFDEEDNLFIWKGHCQGRHGQVWNENSEYHFRVDHKGEIVEVWTNRGSHILPTRGEFRKSLDLLLALKE